MKRRRFIETGSAGAVGLGLSGCSVLGKKVVISKPEQKTIDFTTKVPKPQGTI